MPLRKLSYVILHIDPLPLGIIGVKLYYYVAEELDSESFEYLLSLSLISVHF